MKKVGANAKVTKKKILDSATNEFYAKGFDKASLRDICEKANVTTGALYFFFKDKDDLFNNVIAPVVSSMKAFMNQHYASDEAFKKEVDLEKGNPKYDVAFFLVNSYFENKKVWYILYTNLRYPSIRKMIECFIKKSIYHYQIVINNKLKEMNSDRQIDEIYVRQFVDILVFTLIHLFHDDCEKDEMIERAKKAVKMLRGAFRALWKEE